MSSKEKIQELLTLADIKINGSRPWDIQVHNEKLYDRVLAQGSLGLGESYMDGWWDVKALDQFFTKLLSAQLDRKVRPIMLVGTALKAALLNLQTKSRSKKVAQEHYDLGNEFYENMLDPEYMQYTCAYWNTPRGRAKNLSEAQKNKLDLICRKLKLKKGETVLELGGGWGGFAYYAAKHYGVKVTSYNISKEQVAYAKKKCKGLPVTFKLDDYRNATGTFDKVVSIGMMEHVGYKNYEKFFALIRERLKDGGLALVHTIGGLRSVTHTDPWIEKYIFPNSMLPSMAQITKALEKTRFVLEDYHNIGADYDPTLMAWYKNYKKNWKKFEKDYGERFARMWDYYLLACAGSFRCRRNQLFQIVLSKEGVPGGYMPER